MYREYAVDIDRLAEAKWYKPNSPKHGAIIDHVERLQEFEQEDTLMVDRFQRFLREARNK